jgi:hypothetical protein
VATDWMPNGVIRPGRTKLAARSAGAEAVMVTAYAGSRTSPDSISPRLALGNVA